MPWKSLVPERVTMLTTAPPVCPYSAEKKFVCILNSCTTSTEGVNFRSVMPEFCSTVVTVTPSSRTSEVEFREPFATKLVLLSELRAPARPDHARRHIGQSHRVARDVRQGDDVLVFDDLAEVGDGGVQKIGGGGDLNRGADIPDLEDKVDGRLLLDHELHRRARQSFEACRLDRDRVAARRQRTLVVATGAVGGYRVIDPAVGLGDDYPRRREQLLRWSR